jgi:hypothetical protein
LVAFPLLQTAVTISSGVGFSGDQPTTRQGATLSFDRASGHYGLTLNNEGLAVVDATATQADHLVNGFHSFGSPISGGRDLQTYVAALDYSVYGYWLIYRYPLVGGYESTNGGAFLGGLATPAGSIPTNGTAIYAGYVTGLYDESFLPAGDTALVVGKVDLSADFGARNVSGRMTNLGIGSDMVAHSPMNDVVFMAAFDPAQNLFSGTTSVATVPAGSSAFAADASGVVQGRFFGPSSNEVGAVWTLSDSVRRIVGSFSARRQ